jgi:large subunit ribosomal protein L12e
LENRSGNVTWEDIKKIGEWLHNEGGSMAREMEGSVSQVIGTCRAIGLTIDNRTAKEVGEDLASGEITL